MELRFAALAALADPARWRIVEVLAERPRSVGVVAQLTGLRQPQATKHLQTLERAGLVISMRQGQRRIFALETDPLRSLAGALDTLADTVLENRGDRKTFDAYFVSRAAEVLMADRERWADERVYTFTRTLTAPPEQVWPHLTESDLLACWWTPRDLAVVEAAIEPRKGGLAVLAYADRDDATGTDGIVGRAEGVVDEAAEPERLAFRLSPLLPDGSPAFTGHYDLTLRPDGHATVLDVRLTITNSTIAGAEMIAGIEIGWSQSLDQLVNAVRAATSTTDTTQEKK